MKRDILKQLRDLGFSEREASVYLCLVEKTETTPYIISTTLSLPRTTIYQTLEKLKKQGLVLASRKNGVLYYSPESFTRLRELVETKQKALQIVLPQLQMLSDASKLHEPTSHVYLGLEATKAVWEDMIEVYGKRKATLVYATSNTGVYSLYGRYLSAWIERRWKLALKTLLIFPESQRNSLPFERHPDKEDIRFLPDEFLYSGEITVYGNKTAIFSFDGENTYAIVVDSPEVADIFTKTFRLMWQVAKE